MVDILYKAVTDPGYSGTVRQYKDSHPVRQIYQSFDWKE